MFAVAFALGALRYFVSWNISVAMKSSLKSMRCQIFVWSMIQLHLVLWIEQVLISVCNTLGEELFWCRSMHALQYCIDYSTAE